MFSHTFTVKPLEWNITVVYDVTCEDVPALKEDYNILRDNYICGRIYNRFRTCGNKTGFTCTDKDASESIVLIGKCTDYCSVLNTIVHETGHVAVHLSDIFDIDFEDEEFCYLLGYIGETMLCEWLKSKNVFIQ